MRGAHGVRSWRHAFPQGEGDLLSLRAMEQGLDQMRRVPGREVKVDIAPGDQPGESFLDVAVKDVRPVSLTLSGNNLAGPTVGRWQGSAQLSTLNLLGLSEIATVSINSRLQSPSLPADSRSTGASFTIPFGWWTLGVSANRSDYAQRVIGEVKDFQTDGRLDTVSAWVERVIHRDRTSKTSLRLSVQRRRGRSFIDGIEIGLQRQDLTDLEFALVDRHRIGRVQIDTQLSHRRGMPWLGAQAETDDRPASLPTARYRITTADVSLNAPLGPVLAYRGAFHGQWSDRPLYGSDQISVGGPFTVRGFDSDQALIGRAGWYLRQELTARLGDHLQPYVLADTGHVRGTHLTPIGVGMGLRAQAFGASLDAWIAIPFVPKSLAGDRPSMIGVTAGWTL
ncbi:ShlB/FhaC/HecB family hemolysin secretion/activation protein [Sphingobium sp. B12D2B]|uniref:ShlB/FhaC/HecB family hemolysin secretion/activation protein n=1 Tax=Sphingobium sp. B12D2B TaxID=2940577 RepID=UPI0022257119|nr:ShlB/FhaC/HecB family hemolysin secretion/activation protein [Sphingobium sp. B12D2B]MCW2351802.1 hemolysin activation/secretion protein [Sphingobium sp. B12D2B]